MTKGHFFSKEDKERLDDMRKYLLPPLRTQIIKIRKQKMPEKKCKTCKWWTPKPYKYEVDKEKFTIHGGECGNRDKFIHGYNLPNISFKEDCITFCIDWQTKSLYYCGAEFGCIHWTEKGKE